MVISQVVRTLRLTLGLEQKEFGDLLNVTPGTVCNWECKKRIPRLPKIRKMVEIAKVNNISLTIMDFLREANEL